MSHYHLDTQSVAGTLLSILFIMTGKLFEVLNIVEFLQGFAYFATVIVAVDTLSGNKIQKYFIKKFNNNEDKPKRNRTDKKV